MWLSFTLTRHVDTIRVQGPRVSSPERARDSGPPCPPCMLTARGQGGRVAVQRAARGGGAHFPHHSLVVILLCGEFFFFLVKICILYFIIFK